MSTSCRWWPVQKNVPEGGVLFGQRFDVGEIALHGGVLSGQGWDQLLRQPATFRSRQK